MKIRIGYFIQFDNNITENIYIQEWVAIPNALSLMRCFDNIKIIYGYHPEDVLKAQANQLQIVG
jgi:hypothetical protein